MGELHLYSAYGLTVGSEVELPELMPGAGTPAVRIIRGPVPSRLSAPRRTGTFFEAGNDTFLLRFDSGLRIRAAAGAEVIVDAPAGVADFEVRTMLLGPVLTAILHQRGVLVLHAGAIVGRSGALLVGGASGSGKSTLLAALTARGYPFLTDDVAPVRLDDSGRPVVSPGFPRIGLWKDAIERSGTTTAAFERTRMGSDKYSVPLDPARSERRPQVVTSLCRLAWHAGEDITIDEVGGQERFRTLCATTRNFDVLEGLDLQEPHFRLASAAARGVRVFQVNRSRRASVDEVADAVLAVV